jgi:serine-type D-Ala-D-Ala carboxypeptidase/endopeptidase (penicillin-binding protein 4)
MAVGLITAGSTGVEEAAAVPEPAVSEPAVSEPAGAERSAPQRQADPARAVAMAVPPAIAELRTRLGDLVDHPARRTERWSILAVSLDRGDTLIARAPDQALAPASNMKLFTTAAALEYLGAEHRFTTYLIADGPIREGVLEGNLYLYGTGDPTLGTRFAERPAAALVALADTLALLGVREIRGALIGDGSFFSGPGHGAGWQETYMNAWYAASAGALSVHENLVRIEVRPGAAGAPPELKFIPGGRGVAVRNAAVSGGGGRASVLRGSYDGPIQVTGRVGSASTGHAVPINDPAMYAAALMRDVLEDRKILVHGGARAIEDAEQSPITGRTVFAPALDEGERQIRVLAEHRSGPLQEILGAINRDSHNFYSEQVLRAVGRAATGVGTAHAGGWAVKNIIARAGVDTTGVRIADGSGLSALNSASATDFVTILAYMASSPHAEAFLGSLPVAGQARRFRRMGGTPAGGNLMAKTGTITRVTALSGYVTAANGELIAFSIIGNDLGSVAQGKHIENAIGIQLASFNRTDGLRDPRGGTGVPGE